MRWAFRARADARVVEQVSASREAHSAAESKGSEAASASRVAQLKADLAAERKGRAKDVARLAQPDKPQKVNSSMSGSFKILGNDSEAGSFSVRD